MTTAPSTVVGSRSILARLDGVSAGTLVAVALSLGMWAIGLGRVDLAAMTDVGLVSVLPPLLLAGIVLVTLSFSIVVTLRPGTTWLVFLHVVALIVMLFAVTALVEPEPRFSVAWRHAGIIENLTRTGVIDPAIDAYFSWPGFFALGALFTQVLGLSSALDLAPWAPLVFNLLYLPAILLILRAGTGNVRLIWVGTWLFFVGNWIGQDYFSPQGLDYFLYLLVIGILLTWFRSAPAGTSWLARWFQPVDEPSPPVLTAFQRAAMVGIVVLLFATTVYSHQLTPFALLGLAIALVVTRRISTTGLPTVLAVLLGTWLSYMTVSYLSGHISSLLSRVGNVDTTVAANLVERVRGSDQHLIVIIVRLANTAAIFGLAGIGALHRLVSGRRDITWPLLAVTPFGLLLLQDYGGEMLLRVYMFSLPFVAFLAASALVEWRGVADRLRRAVPIALVATLLVAAFLVSRYGNERGDYITTDEATGMQQLYRIAPADSTLVGVAGNIVWKFTDYELYHYRIVTPGVTNFDLPGILEVLGENSDRAGFLILSRTQRALLEMQYGFTDADWQRFQRMVTAEPSLQLVYSNPDVEIYRLRSTAS